MNEITDLYKRPAMDNDVAEMVYKIGTAIGWTHVTLNAWWGCQKVSPGCALCYAERETKRFHSADYWGPDLNRKLIKSWQRKLKRTVKISKLSNVPILIFAQSMSDTFEDLPGGMNQVRYDFLEALKWATEEGNIEVQLLTKRPENVFGMVPVEWTKSWPRDIWLGTSAENQEYADKRIPVLTQTAQDMEIPTTFVSIEPLIGPAGLMHLIAEPAGPQWAGSNPLVQWIITGGESGLVSQRTRIMNPDWVKEIEADCSTIGIPHFFKQHGDWLREDQFESWIGDAMTPEEMRETKYKDREVNGKWYFKCGKKHAGNTLSGRKIEEFPHTEKMAEMLGGWKNG